MSDAKGRQARVERKTKETDVTIHLDVDGTGASKVATPIPFFSHMLEAWSKHGERARHGASVAFRLLRCHARAADCAREFGAQAR